MPDEAVSEYDADEAIMTEFSNRLSDQLSHGGYGFDPMTIITIISIVVQVIKMCSNKPAAAQLKRKGLLARVRLHAAISQSMPASTWEERRDVASGILNVAAESTDEECERFMAACNRG